MKRVREEFESLYSEYSKTAQLINAQTAQQKKTMDKLKLVTVNAAYADLLQKRVTKETANEQHREVLCRVTDIKHGVVKNLLIVTTCDKDTVLISEERAKNVAVIRDNTIFLAPEDSVADLFLIGKLLLDFPTEAEVLYHAEQMRIDWIKESKN